MVYLQPGLSHPERAAHHRAQDGWDGPLPSATWGPQSGHAHLSAASDLWSGLLGTADTHGLGSECLFQ